MTEYTQFPVYKGNKYVGLLTDGSIARWAAHAMDGLSHAPMEYDVAYLLRYEKRIDQAKFVSRTTTVYEAEEILGTATRAKTGNIEYQQCLLLKQEKQQEDCLELLLHQTYLYHRYRNILLNQPFENIFHRRYVVNFADPGTAENQPVFYVALLGIEQSCQYAMAAVRILTVRAIF